MPSEGVIALKVSAGVDAPAFVERSTVACTARLTSRVAGVDAPAFVERQQSDRLPSFQPRVSPGLMPRPSLSGEHSRVNSRGDGQVSPGLMPRPSLSERVGCVGQGARVVSPGLMPRPSLSGDCDALGPRPFDACRRG